MALCSICKKGMQLSLRAVMRTAAGSMKDSALSAPMNQAYPV